MYTIIASPFSTTARSGIGLGISTSPTPITADKKWAKGNPLSYFLKEPKPEPETTPTSKVTLSHSCRTQTLPPVEFVGNEDDSDIEDIDILQPGKLITNGWELGPNPNPSSNSKSGHQDQDFQGEVTVTEEAEVPEPEKDGFDFDPEGNILEKIMAVRQQMQQEKLSIEQNRAAVQAELDQQKKIIGQMRNNLSNRESQLAERLLQFEEKYCELLPLLPSLKELQSLVQTSSAIIRDVSSFNLGHTLTAISKNCSFV
jgi:hypothetical protein